MAYIRTHETKATSRGKVVKRYEVCWRVHVNGAVRLRQRSFATREAAEDYLPQARAAERAPHTTDPSERRRRGERPLADYASDWVAAQELKVSTGALKRSTLDGYALLLRAYALPKLGHMPVGSISAQHVERCLAELIGQPTRQGSRTLSPRSVRQVWNVLRRVFVYAMQHDAITSNPLDRVDFSGNRATGDRERFAPHPLTGEQIAELSAALAGNRPGGDGALLPAYPVYALMVEFAAYTGLRKAELAGLEIADVVFAPGTNAPSAVVKVARTKIRKDGRWITGTPKSRRSRRTVPLPGWLAARMADYLSSDPDCATPTHPRASEPDALLWPGRTNAGGYRDGRSATPGERRTMALDWTEPIDLSTFSRRILAPALRSVGLPVSSPATPQRTRRDGTIEPAEPATRGVRFHDLRHTFAVLQLSAGVPFMQVSKWLGHSAFSITLDVYGDWISTDGEINALPAPKAADVVVAMHGRRG